MTATRKFLFLASVLILGACTPAPEDATVAVEPAAAAGVQATASDTPVTIENLMTASVMPNADQIWRAVSYVANAQGVTETQPETAEDWAKLRESALALIDAGDALMDTNREIFSGEFDQATASYQFTPDEIKQLIIGNPQPWQNYIREMQDSTRMTLQAIDLKDLAGLQDFGARINEACEGCHAAYLYRPPQQMAPQ